MSEKAGIRLALELSVFFCLYWLEREISLPKQERPV